MYEYLKIYVRGTLYECAHRKANGSPCSAKIETDQQLLVNVTHYDLKYRPKV